MRFKACSDSTEILDWSSFSGFSSADLMAAITSSTVNTGCVCLTLLFASALNLLTALASGVAGAAFAADGYAWELFSPARCPALRNASLAVGLRRLGIFLELQQRDAGARLRLELLRRLVALAIGDRQPVAVELVDAGQSLRPGTGREASLRIIKGLLNSVIDFGVLPGFRANTP